MPFVSELTGKPVTDIDGERVGILEDLVASVRSNHPHPQIIAILVKRGRQELLVPFSDVAVLVAPAVPLIKRIPDIKALQPAEHDLYLMRDVMDKQIIDTDGVRVVRVNDLELKRVENHFYIANVDISAGGVARRLGLSRLLRGSGEAKGMISWEHVELLPEKQPLRLKVRRDKISELHPADLAEIVSDLPPTESTKLLESLDVKTVAGVLEEVEPDFQASLVERMPDEKVADVLEEMAPDEAADLLGELSDERSQELLRLMEQDNETQVRKLLSYPVDLAGGIMTTDYIAVRPGLSAEQVLAVLRQKAASVENFFYVYVVNEENCLMGVFSLQDLVLAKPRALVTEFMHQRLASVNLLDSQEDVAQMVAKYNLLAIPVVDELNRLHGIVTADDALDKIIPTKWKKRLPKLYH